MTKVAWSWVALAKWYFEGKRYYGHKGYLSASKTWSNPTLQYASTPKKQFLITGANAGLGFSMAKQIYERGGHVHLVCRNKERAEAAREKLLTEPSKEGEVSVHLVDMGEFADVRKFAAKFQKECSSLDVLIHNAGVMMEEESFTSEGKEVTVATMLGGTHLLVALLTPLLASSSYGGRVINVASAGQYTVPLDSKDLNGTTRSGKSYDGTFSYSVVKRQQVALTEKWAEVLKPKGISVFSMHPGWATSPGLQRSMPNFHDSNVNELRSADEGADTAVYLALADELTTDQSGTFWFDRKVVRKHFPLARTGYSASDVQELWDNATKFCECAQDIPTQN